MFALLPSGFQSLHAAVEALGKFSLAAPPPLNPIGLRMRKVYAAARADGYQHLSRGALRRLPYALWIEGQPPPSIEDGLCRGRAERR